MKTKSHYLRADGSVNRVEFRHDLMGKAYELGEPVSVIFAAFVKNNGLSGREMGTFAMEACNGEFAGGVILLIHALEVTRHTVSEYKLLVSYIPVNPGDIAMLSLTWDVDRAMNWPLGTLMPESRRFLAKF